MLIEKVKINAFRGIPELTLNLDGKSLLLQGENGTGKSSIVDALEFFFTGNVAHLSGTQSLSLKNHAPNVNFSPEDLKVEIQFKDPSFKLERTLNSNLDYPDSVQNEFKSVKNGRFILHRSQILNLIESKPSERYKFIGSIFDFQTLESSEIELQRAKRYLNDKVKYIENEIIKIFENIGEILETNISDKDDVLNKLNKLLSHQGYEILDSIESLEDYLKHLEGSTHDDNIGKINALNAIIELITDLNTIYEDISENFNKSEDFKKEIFQKHQMLDLALIKVLENAKKIIHEEDNVCPLCEQDIDGEKLLYRIDDRLNELYDISDTKDKLKNHIEIIEDGINSFITNLNLISKNIDLFTEFDLFEPLLKNELIKLDHFKKKITYQTFLEGFTTRKDFNLLKNGLQNVLNELSLNSKDLKESINLISGDIAVLKLVNILQKVNIKVKELFYLENDAKKLKKQLIIADKLYSTFSDIKKSNIQKIYDSIELEIDSFYEYLHPNESHQNIKIDIDSKRKASTNLKMDIFGRENEDPRALNSEGHLDSLGLCIFLALVRKFNENFPIMVLDDIVTTVDSRHRENVCKLLFEEFGDKQLIITTHDSIWYDQLKAAQRAYKLENNFRNMNIIGWDLIGGPIIRPYKPRWDKIMQRISEGDRNCAANEGRRYLEWLLEEISKSVKVPIPLNQSGRYTVKELFDPTHKKLIDKIKDVKFKEKIEESFQHLEKTMIMGNLLSHNNPMASNVSMQEVENFCVSVKALDELMRCPECNNMIQYYRELNILRCSKKNCKNPLEIKLKDK